MAPVASQSGLNGYGQPASLYLDHIGEPSAVKINADLLPLTHTPHPTSRSDTVERFGTPDPARDSPTIPPEFSTAHDTNLH